MNRILLFLIIYLCGQSLLAQTGKGWKDCGSDLQEFSSHVVVIDVALIRMKAY